MPALVAGIHALRHHEKKTWMAGTSRAITTERQTPARQRNFSRTPLPYTAVDSPPRFKLTPMFWTGLGLLVFGTGPLLAIILAASLGLLSDPDPNPIGPGLLAFFTFWPAVILIVWGLIASLAIGARKRNPEITPPAR